MYRLLMTGDRSTQYRRAFHAISDQDRAYSAARVDKDRKSPCSICARFRPPPLRQPSGRRSQRPIQSVGKLKTWRGSRRLSLLGLSHSPAPCRENHRTADESYLKHGASLADERSGLSSEASLAPGRFVPMSPLASICIVCIESGVPITCPIGIRGDSKHDFVGQQHGRSARGAFPTRAVRRLRWGLPLDAAARNWRRQKPCSMGMASVRPPNRRFHGGT
jgi:hypothetical protein